MSRLAGIQLIALAVAVRLSATNAGTAAVDVSGFSGEARLVLNSSAGEGASHTMTTKLQHSADGSTGWSDVPDAAFAQVTNAAASFQTLTLNIDKCKKFVRVVDTLAGTTPFFTRSVELLAKADRV